MKTVFAGIVLLLSQHLVANIERVSLPSNLMPKFTKNLEEIFKETGSSGANAPEMKDLKKVRSEDEHFFCAVYDSFGMNRYFRFENDEDIKTLVQGCKSGGAMSIKWMALKKSIATEIELEGIIIE